MSDETQSQRRRGKIAQCPRRIREEICRLLDDGRQGPDILTWANAQPEVIELIARDWEGHAISDNNLSQWFKGGFLEWRAQQLAVEQTAAKAELSIRLAKAAGGSLAEGVLAVAAGKIMTELESAEGEHLVKLTSGVVALRGREIDKERTDLARDRNAMRREVIELDREKFERLVVGKFIDWAQNEEAIRLATSDEPREVVMPQLMELMFGPRPTPNA